MRHPHRKRAKSRTVLPLVVAVTFTWLLAHSPVAKAVPPSNILADEGKFKATFTFTESYSDKVETIPMPNKTIGHDLKSGAHKISVRAIANIQGFDFSEISSATTFHLAIGKFTFDRTLGYANESHPSGDSMGYFPIGTKKATFTLYSMSALPNGRVAKKAAGQILLKWTESRLTVTLTCPDTKVAEVLEIAGSDFTRLYQDTSQKGDKPAGSVKFSGNSLDATLAFGSAAGQRTIAVKGISSTAYKKFGTRAKANVEELFPETVSLTGSIAR